MFVLYLLIHIVILLMNVPQLVNVPHVFFSFLFYYRFNVFVHLLNIVINGGTAIWMIISLGTKWMSGLMTLPDIWFVV